MPNFISEDDVEQGLVQKLRHPELCRIKRGEEGTG
jgi:hypothetical protein